VEEEAAEVMVMVVAEEKLEHAEEEGVLKSVAEVEKE
jgi:hypothetical protein